MWAAIILAVCVIAGIVDFFAIRHYRHCTWLIKRVKLVPFIGLVVGSMLIVAAVIFPFYALKIAALACFFYFLPLAFAYRIYCGAQLFS